MYEFDNAEGIYLIDKTGRQYVDLISGIAVNNVGHKNKKVNKAIKDQVDRYLHQMVYGEYLIGPQVELAKKLNSLLPQSLNSFYFVNSGSEAIEGAMKLARKHTGKSKIVALRNAYHGSTAGALSLMSNEYYSSPFKPLLPEVYFAEANNSRSLSVIDENTAAVFIEPIQAESGYTVLEKEFISALRTKCNETKTLLIFDEVQTGIGRTGDLFAFQGLNIIPDIVVSAKGLGGGMPIGCFMADKGIMDSLMDQPILGHITTFGGHPVSCAAAIATLDFLEEEQLIDQIEKKEALFRKYLQHRAIHKITGKGLMLAIHLDDFETVTTVIDHCYKNQLIIDWFLYANNALRIAPPLIITDEEIEMVCSKILKALDSLTPR